MLPREWDISIRALYAIMFLYEASSRRVPGIATASSILPGNLPRCTA